MPKPSPTPIAPDQVQPTRLLTEAEAADFLKCSRKALQKWRCVGTGPTYVKLNHHAVRYRMQDLLAWIETCVHVEAPAKPIRFAGWS